MELVTLIELSDRANVPESNVRRYVKFFPTYIPCSMVGKQKMYSTDFIPVIQFIAGRYLAHTPTDLIGVELEQDPRFQVTLDMEVPELSRHSATPEMGLSVEVFGQMAQAVAQQGEVLRQMVQALDKSREIAELRDEVEWLKQEHNKRVDEDLRRKNEKKPWWKVW